MTAEIAILNKEAIALAADSAMTAEIGDGRKVFTTANKIFMLYPGKPVGVMVYNNAQFIGVPWETIIYEIGKKVPVDGFKTLNGYVKLFLSYFGKESYLFPKEEQERYLMRYLDYGCLSIKDVIVERVDEELRKRRPLSEKSVKILVAKAIKDELNEWIGLKEYEKASSIKLDMSEKIVKYYRSSIQEVLNEVFQKIPMSKRTTKNILEILKCYISFGADEQLNAGVVIAGFGEREAFPSLKSFRFEGLFNGKLRYSREAETSVGKRIEASIIPFAQREMVARFMEGVDPDYREAEENFLSELSEKFPQAIVKNLKKYTPMQREKLLGQIKDACKRVFDGYRKGMDRMTHQYFTEPITEVVAMLPKADLATLAESLVSLTCIKRKFSSGSETVAEPIDVAVISRSDGLIWIKHKSYY